MELRSYLIALFALFVLVIPGPAAANMARPWGGGQPAGEPAGSGAVVITHEDLAIDMRALGELRGLVGVRATYELENRGSDTHLDLLFASGANELEDLHVTLDGKAIATRVERDFAIPPSWQAPARTPLPDGSGTLNYELDPIQGAAPVGFAIDLGGGRHRLSVDYSAEAMFHRIGDPTVVRQFAYVLAPARTWDGFGGLDVAIQVPSGWRESASPTLAREGDTLRGHFVNLPADSIAVAVQAPWGMFRVVQWAALGALACVVIAGGRWIHRRAKATAQKNKDRSILLALGLGAAWGAVFFAVGMFAIIVPSVTLAKVVADESRVYLQMFEGVLVIVGSGILLVIGTVLALAAGRGVRVSI